jgi:hypothetical protein
MFNIVYDKNSGIIISYGFSNLVSPSEEHSTVQLENIPFIMEQKENVDKTFVYNESNRNIEVLP